MEDGKGVPAETKPDDVSGDGGESNETEPENTSEGAKENEEVNPDNIPTNDSENSEGTKEVEKPAENSTENEIN